MLTLSKKLSPKVYEGFTVIETLIVLTIAGVILTIILAVLPALQRDSRNNQRKQDVATILNAVSHYELNNSGNFPSPAATSSNDFLYYVNQGNKLTYYNGTSENYFTGPGSFPASGIGIYSGSATDSSVTYAPNNSLEAVYIVNYQKCDSNSSGGSSNAAAGYGDVVALYALENGNAPPQPECQQL